MSEKAPLVDPADENLTTEELPGPLRCWTGSGVAGGMAIAAYLITRAIAVSFANSPPTGNALALRIGITVRTLIIGISTMATGIFSLIAISLFILGIKSLLASAPKSSPSQE